jgi:hypothetical protein
MAVSQKITLKNPLILKTCADKNLRYTWDRKAFKTVNLGDKDTNCLNN